MKPDKTPNLSAKDKIRQKKIEERIKTEKIELNHAAGKERFEKVVKRALKKKTTN